MIKHILIRLAIILVGTPIVFYAILYFRQESIIFIPSQTFNPIVYKMGAEDVYFETADGYRLHALELAKHHDGKYVLFFHGNAGNVSDRDWQILLFDRLGLNVLMPDYRGYGKSEGRLKRESDLYKDADSAFRYLREEKNISTEDIIIWGRSLGGAVAVDLASRQPAGALVIESSYSSALSMKRKHYSYVPDFLIKYKMESDKKIGLVKSPLFVIHSLEDEMIDIEDGRLLYELANEPKWFLEIRGVHNDGVFVSEEEYKEGITVFFQKTFPRHFDSQ